MVKGYHRTPKYLWSKDTLDLKTLTLYSNAGLRLSGWIKEDAVLVKWHLFFHSLEAFRTSLLPQISRWYVTQIRVPCISLLRMTKFFFFFWFRTLKNTWLPEKILTWTLNWFPCTVDFQYNNQPHRYFRMHWKSSPDEPFEQDPSVYQEMCFLLKFEF